MKDCLVIDDSNVVRKLLCNMIIPMGFSVREAENGENALAHCMESMPQVIMLDWNMPVMDGPTFLKKLRAFEGGSQPVVIFCTTENDMEHIQLGMSLGANEYIMKPFDEQILQSKFSQLGLVD